MSLQLSLPRVGHLKELLNIFAYLKVHTNSELVFDPNKNFFDKYEFPRQDWTYSIYHSENIELREGLTPDMTNTYWKGMNMLLYANINHAGDYVTRRSRSGLVVFFNNEPICWISKKQTSCITSTYGSNRVAMKQSYQYVFGLWYKLIMMGILVEDPTYVHGENHSMLDNSTMPEST